jgi:hypothetical protein
MSVNLKYYDEFGNPYILSRDDNGFWQSRPDPDPNYFETTFTNFGSLDTGLTVAMDGIVGDWFQIDNVKLYGNDDVDDNYNMSIRPFNDAELSGNPQLYAEISEFPNPLTEILVPVNEFITHSSFNTILTKMQENYEFLIEKAQFLSVPPNAISFRYGYNTYDDYDGQTVWTQADNGLSQFWGYDPEMNVDHVAGTPDAMVHCIDNVLYGTTTLSGGNPPIDSRDFYIYGTDTFTDIKSIETDSNNYIWVLDDLGSYGKVGIFSYEENWRFQSSWEFTTAGNNKYFVDPTDLKIKDGRVYISCKNQSGDGVEIRTFTEVGSYEGSMSHEELLNIESIAVTTEYVIALYDNKLFRFTVDFEFVDIVDMDELIFTYDYFSKQKVASTINRLGNNNSGVFFYGIAGNLIYKFGQDGDILESFGETAVNYMNSTLDAEVTDIYYDKNVSDVYHDVDYNLYASSEYDVVKYYDRAEVYNRLLDDDSFNIERDIRSEELLDVNSEENTTAWVYNRVFDRILDNLNVYRLALKGSQALITTNTFEYVVVSNFKPTDFIPLAYQKGDIAIGVNELHCEGALNRCLRQLYECFETCLGYINIKDTGIDPDALRFLSFELFTQNEPLPIANLLGNTYYFDAGRYISDVVVKWVDTISYRGDPKLRAYMTTPLSGEYELGRFPVPNTFTDTNTFVNDDLTWTVRETYDILDQSASLNVKWSTRLYAGKYPDSITNPTGANVKNHATWTEIAPTMDGVLPPIPVVDGEQWYIAVPADEWDAGTIKIYHPDYPEMEYDFLGYNKYLLVDPDFQYGNVGENYYVFRPTESTYNTGIDEIKFKL